jgi:hypothetical protein
VCVCVCVCVYLHFTEMSPELSKIQSSSCPQTLKEGFYTICDSEFSICRHSMWNIRRFFFFLIYINVKMTFWIYSLSPLEKTTWMDMQSYQQSLEKNAPTVYLLDLTVFHLICGLLLCNFISCHSSVFCLLHLWPLAPTLGGGGGAEQEHAMLLFCFVSLVVTKDLWDWT